MTNLAPSPRVTRHSLTPSVTRSPVLSLSAKLRALLDDPSPTSDLPVVGPVTAAALRDLAAIPEPADATPEQVESMLARLSLAKPKRGSGDAEAAELVKIYARALRGVAAVDLAYAYDKIVAEDRWFPGVERILDLASLSRGQRSYYRSRARRIVQRHEREWSPPGELADADALRSILPQPHGDGA